MGNGIAKRTGSLKDLNLLLCLHAFCYQGVISLFRITYYHKVNVIILQKLFFLLYKFKPGDHGRVIIMIVYQNLSYFLVPWTNNLL